MGASAGPTYEYLYNHYDNTDKVTCSTAKATDHSQIVILEADWKDIKRLSSNLIFEKRKFDTFSLFIGATVSTAIPLMYSLYTYFTKEGETLNEAFFYLFFTAVFLIISVVVQSKSKNEDTSLIRNETQHENLMIKIKEIDERKPINL